MDLRYLILLVIYMYAVWVDGQLDSNGFINIDCGRAPNTSFYNSNTKSTYVSDDQFIDTGENHKIDSNYAIQGLFEELLTVRSFPSGTRNCYTLRSLTVGSKYLVRGQFMYGNYDNLNKIPTFDLYLGVNYWRTIDIITEPDSVFFTEIIVTATSDYLQVCLVNTKQGTPFISDLHLSELKQTMYEMANSTQSLVYFDRGNMGASYELRYPDDPYDRIWRADTSKEWKNISTNSTQDTDTPFETPSAVMQTAVTTLNITQPLTIYWSSDDASTTYFVILHSSEIGVLTSKDVREFDILTEGIPLFSDPFVPSKLAWASYTNTGYKEYNFTFKSTSNSTLPPLLNAYELYVITPATGIPTNNGDVTTINMIKANYKVNKGWSGDPCVPLEYAWTGVTCTSDSTNIPRITALDLSSSGLTGAIVSSFGNLSALESLDLSNNDLTGDLPAFLDKLSSLTYLDITGNEKLSTNLPSGLQSKKQDGNLIFRSGAPDKSKKTEVIIAVVIVAVVILLIGVAIIIVLCSGRHKYLNLPQANSAEGNNAAKKYANATKPNEAGQGILDFDNRRYTYNDLARITNKFQNHVGSGGFGSVYVGFLDDGTQVAVKTRSHTSNQGVKEFLAEAQNLSRVHHRNLVSLIGYCMDGDCMALIYEYMQEGTLKQKLKVSDNTRSLRWNQRVRIAYESALGLEYLHTACNPPLIHRDVKTSNILLNEKLEAKIADFGLSREFNTVTNTHVLTAVVGTPGYLDPEYHSAYQLSKKSDVFSFGVVLLEIITAKPPIIADPEGCHLREWVNEKLSRGDIESIMDPNMQGQYDINSVWKVTELACKCTESSSSQRPTMSMVVAELKECHDLEMLTEGIHGKRTTNNKPHNYSRNENFANDVSPNSGFQMGFIGGMSESGLEAR